MPVSSPISAPVPSPSARPDPARLLSWYDRHARVLPWRVAPSARRAGVMPDPYRVWLSEIMLQQTTVSAVKPYFDGFLARWPTVMDLAAADEAEVMKAWAGLGYYSRARNLKACAEVVAREHGGRFPATEAALLTLPGIGPYTAAAIAAIAFDVRAVVVDGNVERVITRLNAIATPMPAAKPMIRAAAEALTPKTRPGDFAQAMMDLGATICTPRKPACVLCPFDRACAAQAAGTMETYPVKAPKTERPTRHGTAYVVQRPDGAVLLRRRPPKGLLGGMSEVPSSDWSTRASRTKTEAPATKTDGRPAFAGPWRRLAAPVEHTFTHFHLVLAVEVCRVEARSSAPADHWWSPPSAWDGEALPSLMRKVLELAGRG